MLANKAMLMSTKDLPASLKKCGNHAMKKASALAKALTIEANAYLFSVWI